MKKFFLLVTILCLVNSISRAAYYATYFPTLIEKSNIIVHGRIISVDEENFHVLVLKKIKSNKLIDTLKIQKFQNWSCAARYSKYKIGQEAIYFIRINEYKELEVIGAANEGELIVKDSTTYIKDYDYNKLKTEKFDFLSNYYEYITMDIQTVIEGISVYLNNIEVINREFLNYNSGRVVYQYSYIDRLPKNDFLTIIIDQKRRMYIITYKL
jgi:hypothetical protein